MEGEKNTLRHSWTSNNRQESIAEHSWRMIIMAILLSPYLKKKVDLEKVFKMITIHDMAEIITGDIPAQVHQYDVNIKKIRKQNEIKAVKNITNSLANTMGEELYLLWLECEENKTPEAKFAKALDKLEVRIQHNEAELKTWKKDEYPRCLFAADKFCQFEQVIKDFNKLVKQESIKKLKDANIDIAKLKEEALVFKEKQL